MFHKEGFNIILSAFVIVSLLIISVDYFSKICINYQSFLIVMLILILQFLEILKSILTVTKIILSPVDGKVVIIEEVYEPEFFKDKRLQVSIFMSQLMYTLLDIQWVVILYSPNIILALI